MRETKPLTHPSFDELLALTLDELGDQRAHEVREHLLDCPDCLAQTRELLQLPDEPPSPEMQLSDAELATDWQRLSAKLDGELDETLQRAAPARPQLQLLPGGKGPADAPSTVKPPRRSTVWLVAALISAAAIGLVLGRRSVHSDPSPAVAVNNIASTDFFPRGKPEITPKFECPPPEGSFLWTLAPPLDEKNPPKTLWVEFRRVSGKTVVHDDLNVTRRGEVNFLVPRSSLPNGEYLVTVKLKEDGPTIEEKVISVECP